MMRICMVEDICFQLGDNRRSTLNVDVVHNLRHYPRIEEDFDLLK